MFATTDSWNRPWRRSFCWEGPERETWRDNFRSQVDAGFLLSFRLMPWMKALRLKILTADNCVIWRKFTPASTVLIAWIHICLNFLSFGNVLRTVPIPYFYDLCTWMHNSGRDLVYCEVVVRWGPPVSFFYLFVDLQLWCRHLSDVCASVASIQELLLAHNRLSSLPASMVEMKVLERIDLSHNSFSE